MSEDSLKALFPKAMSPALGTTGGDSLSAISEGDSPELSNGSELWEHSSVDPLPHPFEEAEALHTASLTSSHRVCSSMQKSSSSASSIRWEEVAPLFRGESWQGLEAAWDVLTKNPKVSKLLDNVAKSEWHKQCKASPASSTPRGRIYAETDEQLVAAWEEIRQEILLFAVTHIEKCNGIVGWEERGKRKTANGTLANFFKSRASDAIEKSESHTLGTDAQPHKEGTPYETVQSAPKDPVMERVLAREEILALRNNIDNVSNPNHRLAFLLRKTPELLTTADIKAATGLSRSAKTVEELLNSHWYGGKHSANESTLILTWILFCPDEAYKTWKEWRAADNDAFGRKLYLFGEWARRCAEHMN